ncbi:MAG: hypothetical protein GY750_09635, partial [Lentisphaerae bacterium]|nr:hypothetical protein [Lentisphaerota bacterium]
MNVTDPAGNPGSVTDTTELDTEVTAPTITLEVADSNNDGVYNAQELGSDGTVNATIDLPDDFDATQDTLTINGSVYTLSPEEITAGQVVVAVAPDSEVTAQITDAAGNVSAQVSEETLESDTTGPSTGDGLNSIEFSDGGDELVSASEATNVTLSGQVEVGSNVTSITISDGTTTLTVASSAITVAADGSV